jgi:hypothetical protein
VSEEAPYVLDESLAQRAAACKELHVLDSQTEMVREHRKTFLYVSDATSRERGLGEQNVLWGGLPARVFSLFHDCCSPCPDTIAGRSSVGRRQLPACGFAAEDALRSCANASATFWRTAWRLPN